MVKGLDVRFSFKGLAIRFNFKGQKYKRRKQKGNNLRI
jgi:hypothetical protein